MSGSEPEQDGEPLDRRAIADEQSAEPQDQTNGNEPSADGVGDPAGVGPDVDATSRSDPFRTLAEPVFEAARRFWSRVGGIMEIREARRRGAFEPESPADVDRLLRALQDDQPEPFDPFDRDSEL